MIEWFPFWCKTLMLLFVFSMLRLPVCAQSYLDECMTDLADDVRSTSGFSGAIFDMSSYSGWESCGDATALPMKAARASVTYHISGGERMTAEIYANNSTFAVPYKKELYWLGLLKMNSFKDAVRCFYNETQDTVFFYQEQTCYTLRLDDLGYVFRPDTHILKGDGFYGLNVEVSADGKSYYLLKNLRLVAIESQMFSEYIGTFYREFYTVDLPADITHIRVSLRGSRAYAQDMPLLLSRVNITGERLQFPGRPESSSSASSEESSEPPEELPQPPVELPEFPEELPEPPDFPSQTPSKPRRQSARSSKLEPDDNMQFDTYHADENGYRMIQGGDSPNPPPKASRERADTPEKSRPVVHGDFSRGGARENSQAAAYSGAVGAMALTYVVFAALKNLHH